LAVDALKELDSILVDVLGELNYNATFNTNKEQDGIVVELGELDNIIINAVRESNNTTINILVESDNTTVLVLGGLDNVL